MRVEIKTKELDAIQTVGELLQQTRLHKQVDICDASAELKISPMYLQALEQGQYDKLPCLIYTRNFVKNYATWLNLDSSVVLMLFEKEWNLHAKLSSPQEMEVKESIKRSDFWKLPRWISLGVSALGVMAILTYFGYELYQLRQPPMLTIMTPEAELVIDKQLVEIQGQSEPEVVLSINNQTVLSDSQGYFKEQIALQPGLNIIKVKAKKKHSDEAIVYRKVIVEDKTQFTQAEDTSG